MPLIKCKYVKKEINSGRLGTHKHLNRYAIHWKDSVDTRQQEGVYPISSLCGRIYGWAWEFGQSCKKGWNLKEHNVGIIHARKVETWKNTMWVSIITAMRGQQLQSIQISDKTKQIKLMDDAKVVSKVEHFSNEE